MAILDLRDNITCWLKPETWANVAAGALAGKRFEDSSGHDRDFTCAGTGISLVHDALNGYAVVDLDGTDAALLAPVGLNLSALIAAGTGAVFSVFKARSFATNNANPSLNDAIWAANAATGAGTYLRSVPEVVAFNRSGGANQERVIAIAADAWYVHMWRHRGTRLAAALDDALAFTDIASAGTDSLGISVFLGKNHEATPKFSDIQLAEWLTLNVAPEDQDCATIVNYLLAKYGARGDAHGQAGNLGSRTLFDLREPRLVVTVPELPPAALDVDVGDETALVHSQIPHPAGVGVGEEPWSRLSLRVLEVRPDLAGLKVELVGEKARRHTFYAAAMATKVPGQGLAVDAVAPGPILISRHVPGDYTATDGKAWCERASDGLISALADGELKIEPNGVLCEIDAQQFVPDSALITGAPEWSLSNPTGGTVAYELVADAGLQLFDSAVSTRCLKFTRGTSGTGVASITPSADIDRAADGAAFAMAQIDLEGDMTGFALRLQNGDGDFWDNAAKTWGASPVDNPLTNPNPGGVGQYVSEPIPLVDIAGSAYTFAIRQATGVGSAGDVARVFYAGFLQDSQQIGVSSRLRWPCSRVVQNSTGTATYMGQDHGPIWTNHAGARNWPNARGAALMKVRFRFNTADVVNVDDTPLSFMLLHAYHDEDNQARFYYYRDSDPGFDDGEFRFDVIAGGVLYQAVPVPYTVVRDQLVACWIRWTSAADGELGKPARTLTIGVAGVSGDDAQAGAYPTEAAQSFFGVGACADMTGVSHYLLPLCGWWPNVEVYDECPPDEELHSWGL